MLKMIICLYTMAKQDRYSRIYEAVQFPIIKMITVHHRNPILRKSVESRLIESQTENWKEKW